MGNQEFPSMNETESSWADVSCGFDVTGGELLETNDIAAIKWASKVSVGTRKGLSGGRVTASTAGEIEHSLSVTFYRAGLRKLVRALIAKAPTVRGNVKAISRVFWNLNVQSTPAGEDDIYEHNFLSCRLLSNSFDLKEGSDADKIEVECFVTEILEKVDNVDVALL